MRKSPACLSRTYVEKKIFEPLAMHNSSFREPLPEPLATNMAVSYSPEGGHFTEKPFEIIASFGPAGAQSATATDMVRFAQAILNGGELDGRRILEPATVEQMLTRNFSHDDRLMGMALGFYETDLNGFRVMGHGGDTAWFHSYLGIDQANDLVFFFSFGGPGGSTVRTTLQSALYDEFFPRQEAPPSPPEGFKERASKYAGTYGFWRSNFSTIEKAFGLGSVVTLAPTADDTLVLAFGGEAKQYAEVEENLFRQMSPNFAILGGVSPRLLAFQEDESGAISGFVMDGLPFMSLRKLAFWETPNFNFALLGISLLILIGVLLRRFYQRRQLADQAPSERKATRAAVLAALAHVLVFVIGAIVLVSVASQLSGGVPLAFKLWLILPMLATVAGLYLLYRTVTVWRQGLFQGFWARLRYTAVAVSALFLSWFYWFWNLLGFQYLQ